MFSSSARIHLHPSIVRRRAAGMSMIELLVVIAIMGILTTSLIAGYARFSSQNKVNAALQQINSALHLARNLAIANNHVYHVRLENIYLNLPPIPNPDPTDTANPFIPDPRLNMPMDQQYIAINCFNDMTEAMLVNTQVQTVFLASGSKKIVWNNSNNKTLDNATIVFEALPAKVYAGIQFGEGAAGPFDLVLAFRPDGSASQPLTYFVTDDPKHADDPMLGASNPAAYLQLQDDRINMNKDGGFAKNSSTMVRGTVRMTQVYGGGMIKDLPKVDSSVGTLKK